MKQLDQFLFKALLFITLLGYQNIFAQSIGAPTHGLPTNPIVIGYCSNNGTVDYKTQFTFSGPFNTDNKFRLEISGPNGVFDANTKVLVGPTAFSTSPAVFDFNIPVGISGEGYRLRVSSTSPAVSNTSDTGKPAYYMPYDKGFTLNGNTSSLGICGSGNVTLSVDPSPPAQSSPVGLSGIKFKWYKDDVVISGQTGSSYTTNTGGVYYAEIDYGSCSTPSSITKSQKVTVSFISSSGSFTLNSSKGTSICPSQPTTLSTTPGYSYKWFKNGEEIPNVTTNSYTTGESGVFKVLVGQGNCSSETNSITLSAEDFNLSIDAKSYPSFNYIKENESLIVTATTDAVSPTYEWFEPNNNTSVSTTNTYTVTTPIDGKYKVVVTQNSTCSFSKTIEFQVKIGVASTKIPNLITPNNKDGKNDTWIIPDEYKNSDIEILIVDSYGKEVFKKSNYDDSWPSNPIEFKSVNPIYYYVISKEGNALKKGTITVIK